MSFEKFRGNPHSLKRVLFTAHELRAILSAYSEGVLKKSWKDYAIDAFDQQTVFSVIDHQSEGASVALYSFSKNRATAKNNSSFYYRLFHREAQIFRTESFIEALEFFKALDSKDPKGKKHKKTLRLVE